MASSINTNNTLISVPRRKWRKRRNQNFGSVMLALSRIRGQFYEKSVQLELAQQKLHSSKKDLRKMIEEVQKLEQAVRTDESRCRESVTLLETKADEAKLFDLNSSSRSAMAFRSLYTWSNVEINIARKGIRKTEMELNSLSSIVPANNNLDDHSSTTPLLVAPITINLSDIDELGIIEEGDSIEIDYSQKCCICLERDIDCILNGCAHQCCCSTCARDVQENKDSKCPLCHRLIQKVTKIYYV